MIKLSKVSVTDILKLQNTEYSSIKYQHPGEKVYNLHLGIEDPTLADFIKYHPRVNFYFDKTNQSLIGIEMKEENFNVCFSLKDTIKENENISMTHIITSSENSLKGSSKIAVVYYFE